MIYLVPGTGNGIKSVGTVLRTTFCLARAFGYRYLANTSLPLVHLTDPADQDELYRFVGYHLDEKSVDDPEFGDCPRQEIHLKDIVHADMRSLLDVQRVIESRYVRHPADRKILVLIWDDDSAARNKLKSLVAGFRAETDRDLDFDFKGKYRHSKERYYPEFLGSAPGGKLSVCLHVRRGDVAVVPVGDKLLVNWAENGYCHAIMTPDQFREKRSSFPHFDSALFRGVVDRLALLHGRGNLEVSVFSDGYQPRYFEWVRPHLDELGFADFAALCRYLQEYEEREFSVFEPCRRILGESLDATKKAIHAFVTSDIVIKGTGAFAEFCAESFRAEPPQLMINFRRESLEQIALKLDEYTARVQSGSFRGLARRALALSGRFFGGAWVRPIRNSGTSSEAGAPPALGPTGLRRSGW